jgi:hypothetical protein
MATTTANLRLTRFPPQDSQANDASDLLIGRMSSKSFLQSRHTYS